MRKQELLSWPPCQPPDWRIRENCGTTAGYHSCRKYREDLLASSQIVMSEGRDILEIDVWQDGEGLIIRYFADRKTGKHFAVIRNRVRKLALRNAISVATGGLPDAKRSVYGMSYYDKWDIDAQYAKKEDEERVQNYLGSYTLETWETVQESRRYETAQDRRRKRIEEMMEEETPPVPDDFEAWIRTKAFPREYLITREKPKTTQYTCTACRKTFRRKGKPKAITICPLCGAKVRRTGAEEELQSRVETIYLLVAAECGIPCLIALLAWFGYYLVVCVLLLWRLRHSQLYFIPAGLLGGLLAIYAQSFLEWVLKQQMNFIWLMVFFALLSYLNRHWRELLEQEGLI